VNAIIFNFSNIVSFLFFVASAGAVDEADFENAFYDAPDVKVCLMYESSGRY